MKKILFVASTNSHLMNFHLPYIKHLSENGCEVISAGGGDNMAVSYCTKSIFVPFRKSIFALGNLGCILKLRKLIRQEKIDAVSVHTALAAALVRLSVKGMKNRPCIVNTVHGYLFGKALTSRRDKLMLRVEKALRKQTDSIVVMNGEDFEIARENALTRGKIVKVNGMGVKTELFLTAERDVYFRKDNGFSDSDTVMVFAGEFSDRKNQMFLINTLVKLPESYKLLLLGKGANLEHCKELSKTLGVENRVVFAGHISNVERYYAISDICVSASKIEGLPFGIMEAMAAGLPLVLSDVKGQRDLVAGDDNGKLYELGDENGFIEAVKSIKESGKDYQAINRAASNNYSLETVFNGNMKLYSEMLLIE